MTFKPPKVVYKNVVDEENIDVSKARPEDRASKAETKKMIEERMDRMDHNDPARAVYDKVWKGVNQL